MITHFVIGTDNYIMTDYGQRLRCTIGRVLDLSDNTEELELPLIVHHLWLKLYPVKDSPNLQATSLNFGDHRVECGGTATMWESVLIGGYRDRLVPLSILSSASSHQCDVMLSLDGAFRDWDFTI